MTALPLVPIDANYGDPGVGEAQLLPKAIKEVKELKTTAGTPLLLYSCCPWQLTPWLGDANKKGKIMFIDVRDFKSDGIGGVFAGTPPGKQFNQAVHIPMKTEDSSPVRASAILYFWMGQSVDKKTETGTKKEPVNKRNLQNLLAADYVVIHCVNGEQRSPVMVLSWAKLWLGLTKKPNADFSTNPNQKIALLRGGWKSQLTSDSWPKTVTDAKKKTIAANALQMAVPWDGPERYPWEPEEVQPARM